MKRTNRIRVGSDDIIIESRQEAEDELRAIAELTLERNANQLLLDDQLKKLREQHGSEIAELNDEIDERSERLRTWAELNPGEFKGRKSCEMLHGTIGFRTGTPKLKTIGRKTWDAVLATIKALGLTHWIRTEESVNKEQIIADSRGAQDHEVPRSHVEKKMRDIGVRVAQDETFFVEPKLEDLEKRITKAA